MSDAPRPPIGWFYDDSLKACPFCGSKGARWPIKGSSNGRPGCAVYGCAGNVFWEDDAEISDDEWNSRESTK